MIGLAHADGKLPNLALMKAATYFRGQGETVRLIRAGEPRDPGVTKVYGSSIFVFSGLTRELLEKTWGAITWGGTGVDVESNLTEINPFVDWDAVPPAYDLYPEFRPSLGFSQRGCRLRCGFCVVPRKEGAPRATDTVRGIWRGEGHPRKLVLLDNDPFGVPKPTWRALFDEIRGDPRRADRPRKGARSEFRVCWSQGINARLLDEEAAAALASVEYRSNDFRRRRLYVAWDNLKDEEIFRRGIDLLSAAGVPSKHVMSFMLLGYRPDETWDEILYRFRELVKLGCLPYPMVFGPERALPPEKGGSPDVAVRAHVKRLKAFARWASTGLYRAVPWESYDVRIKRPRKAKRPRSPAGGPCS